MFANFREKKKFVEKIICLPTLEKKMADAEKRGKPFFTLRRHEGRYRCRMFVKTVVKMRQISTGAGRGRWALMVKIFFTFVKRGGRQNLRWEHPETQV